MTGARGTQMEARLACLEARDPGLLGRSVPQVVDLLQIAGPDAAIVLGEFLAWLRDMKAVRTGERDRAIVELVATTPGESARERAAAAESDLAQYAASAWKSRDRSLANVPLEYADTRKELLFRVLRLGGGKVLGAERIRQIVGDRHDIVTVEFPPGPAPPIAGGQERRAL